MEGNVGRNKAQLSFHRSYDNLLQLQNTAKFHTCMLRYSSEKQDHKDKDFM